MKNIIRNVFTNAYDRAAGVADRVRKLRENLVEAKDRSVEFTAAAPGTALWDEMKRNARVASEHRLGLGAMQLIKWHVFAPTPPTTSLEGVVNVRRSPPAEPQVGLGVGQPAVVGPLCVPERGA